MANNHKKHLVAGAMLALSFFGVLGVIFSPIFGDGKNGLQFSDDMFNKLSKGSSYFIPKITKNNEAFAGKNFSISMTLDKPESAQLISKLLAFGGAKAIATGAEVTASGDLGGLLAVILRDSDDMYYNEGGRLRTRYGMDEKEVMVAWWNMLKAMDKAFKKGGKIEESKIVSDVMKKAVEPAYNFYQIEPRKVAEKAGVMTGLLVFYVLYTMWWGFAIFYLFEGFGLTMKKAKVKKEV